MQLMNPINSQFIVVMYSPTGFWRPVLLISLMIVSATVGCGTKPNVAPAPAATAHNTPSNTDAIKPAVMTGARLVRTINKLGQIARLAISEDGKQLLTLEQPGTVRVWDLDSGAEGSLEQAQMFPALEIASSWLGFVGKSRGLVVPMRATNENNYSNTAPSDPVALSADSQWMLSAHRDGRSVDLYHMASARRVRGYAVSGSPVVQLYFSKSGDVFFMALATGEIVMRDLRTGLELRRSSTTAGMQNAAPQVAFSPVRDEALCVFPDGACIVWDLRQGRAIRELQIKHVADRKSVVTRAMFTANGRGLLAALSNGAYVFSDVTSGDELLSLAASPSGAALPLGAAPGMGGAGAMGMGFGGEGASTPLALSVDGHRIVTVVSSGVESSLQVWELPDIAVLHGTDDRSPTAGRSADLTFGIHARSAVANDAAAATFRKLRRAAVEAPLEFPAITIGRGGQRGWGIGVIQGDTGLTPVLHQFHTGTGIIEHSFPIDTASNVTYDGLIVSSDESRLAATSTTGVVVVIDVATRQALSRIAAPEAKAVVRSLSFSRDGKQIVVVRDAMISVHRTDTGGVVRRFSYEDGRPKSNGGQAATQRGAFGGGGFGGFTRSGMEAGPMGAGVQQSPPANAFFSATLSPDAEQLIVVTVDGVLETYEVDSGRKTAEFHCQTPSAVAFMSDGRQVLIGSANASAQDNDQDVIAGVLYDVATGSEMTTLRDAESDPILCGDFSDDGRWIVTGHVSGRCQRWAAETGHKTGFSSLADVDVEDNGQGQSGRGLRPGRGLDSMMSGRGGMGASRPAAGRNHATRQSLIGLTMLGDATQFWTVNGGGSMALWNIHRETSAANAPPPEKDVTTITERGSLRGANSPAITLAISPDLTRSIAVTQTGDLMVWDMATRDLLRQMPGVVPELVSSAITFAPDSNGTAFATGLRGPLVLNLINFSLSAPGVREAAPAKPGTKSTPKSIPKKGKTGANVDLGMAPAGAAYQRMVDAELPAQQQYQGSRVLSVAFYPDGKFLLCGNLDGSVTRVDRANGQSKAIDKRTHPILKVEVSKATQRLMAYDGETVSLWEVASGKAVRQMKVPTEAPGRLEFSADGRRAAVWDERQREIVVLDLDQGTEFKRIALSKGEEGQLPFAISSDGRSLLAGSPSNGVTTIFPERSLATGFDADGVALPGSVAMRAGPAAYNAPVTGAPPPPNRHASLKLIVKHLDPTAGSTDLKLWSLETGKVVALLKGHTEAVVSVAISPDGKTALTAGLDQTVRLWTLP